MTAAAGSNELIQCLLAALSPDAALRHQAETYLGDCSRREGFCLGLIAVVQSPADPAVRQLAAVVLRRHIQKYWTDEDEDAGIPQVSAAEKAQVRAALPASLSDPVNGIQTAVGVGVAEIGKSDCPRDWPELLPGLIGAISAAGNPALVAGAARCLALLAEDLAETQVVEMAPVVFPELLRLAQSDATPPPLRRQAFMIFKTSLTAFEVTFRESPSTRALVAAAMGPWMHAIAVALSTPTTDDSSNWGVKYEALGCIVRAVSSFSKHAAPHLAPALSACRDMLLSWQPLYDQLVVHGEGEGASSSDDPTMEAVDFPDLVSQLFEALLSVLGCRRLLPALIPGLPLLVYYCIGFMQASEESTELWAADVNAYLGEAEEIWGTRASGELLLDEIVDVAGAKGLEAVAEGVARRAAEAAAARQAGNEGWWRLREATLMATGAVADHVTALLLKGKPAPDALNPQRIAGAVLTEDLAPGANAPPFVAARAMWLLSRWSSVLPPDVRSAALRAAASILASAHPPPLQAGACLAVHRLCRLATPEDLKAVSEQTLSGLSSLLSSATDESAHLVLETLTSVVKVDPEGAARWAPHLIPSALKVWVENVVDPLVGEDAEDLLRALASTPGCLPALHQLAMPTLCDVISRPETHQTVLVSSCLDVLTLLLQPASPEAAQLVVSAIGGPTLRLLASTDDEDVAAAATALLRTSVQVGGGASLGWILPGQEPAAAAETLCRGALHVLRPEAKDETCRNVGGLVLELLRAAAPLVSPHLGDLLAAVACKLGTAEYPQTVQSLLGVLAYIAHTDAAQLADLLSKTDAGGGASALQIAMQKWVERHVELRTPYDIRASVAALAALLACPHPALDGVMVRGKRVDTGSGIRTRARAVSQAEQWSQVPLRVKLVMLLSDAYIEDFTQKEGGKEEDDEEEWAQDDDDDEEEDDDEEGGFGGEEDALGLGGMMGGQWDSFGMLNNFVDDTFSEEDEVLGHVDKLEKARREGDQLSTLDVGAFVAETFKGVAQASPALMQAAAAELTPTQVAAVQRIWGGQ